MCKEAQADNDFNDISSKQLFVLLPLAVSTEALFLGRRGDGYSTPVGSRRSDGNRQCRKTRDITKTVRTFDATSSQVSSPFSLSR